jgi:hypothetical protein
MGAVYSVELVLAFDDREAVTERLKECLRMLIKGEHAKFSIDENQIERMRLVDAMNAFLPDILENEKYQVILYDENHFTCTSGFDASYGWETVLETMFTYLAPALKDGSMIIVEPDNESWTMVVKDGVAIDIDAC